jgi:hypothetical protein
MGSVKLTDDHGTELEVDERYAHVLRRLGWSDGEAAAPTSEDAAKAETVITTAPSTLPGPDPQPSPENGGGQEPDVEDLLGDYSSWKGDELRAELDRRGLSKSGVNADLVARLEAADADTTQG